MDLPFSFFLMVAQGANWDILMKAFATDDGFGFHQLNH
jgi:hypothetical protein